MADFLVNGRAVADLALTDRAIHYGDGLFETIAVKEGRPLCWEAHMQRLQAGCTRLNIPCPDTAVLLSEAASLFGDRRRAVLKIIVSRGRGGRGYRPPEACEPSRIVALSPWPDYAAIIYEQGIECTFSEVRLGRVPALAGVKHLNRLEQVLGRADVAGRGYLEGLMLDMDGCIIEGTMTNLFLIDGRSLITPSLDDCGVAGVIRRLVVERASQWDLEAVITEVRIPDLERAGELFVCNSILGICPITNLSAQSWPVGTKTRAIRQSLLEEEIIADP